MSLRRTRSLRPRVEALEERSLMTCNVVLNPADTLTITCDGANDVVIINDDGAGTISGSATGFGAFVGTLVTNIIADTGAGDDNVRYSLVGNLQANTARHVDIALRAGRDVFFGQLYNPATMQGSDLLAGSLLMM